MTDEFVIVDIGLPLPVDVVSTLVQMVGAAYPGASIDARNRDTFGREVLRLLIPKAERKTRMPGRKRIAATKETTDAPESELSLAKFREGIAMSTPKDLRDRLGMIVAGLFVASPLAVNYLEMEMNVTNPDTSEAFTVTVQRRAGKTPHQLRRDAEAECEQLRAHLAELGAL